VGGASKAGDWKGNLAVSGHRLGRRRGAGVGLCAGSRWPPGAHHLSTVGRRLIADRGRDRPFPDPGFGVKGEVDMVVALQTRYPLSYRNVGGGFGAQQSPRARVVPGNARAFDRGAHRPPSCGNSARLAQPGQVGTRHLGGRQLEGPIGAPTRGPFYFTLERAARCWWCICRWLHRFPVDYGGDRKGATCTANSVVAVDVQTESYRLAFPDHPFTICGTPKPAGAARALVDLFVAPAGRTISRAGA